MKNNSSNVNNHHRSDLAGIVAMQASTYGKGFAQVYDKAGFSSFSERMVPYIDQNLERLSFQPESVLDLACGTGTAAILLAKRGLRVYGVDGSQHMLKIAKQKAAEEKVHVEFLLSDMRSFTIPENVDLVVSLYDSLNYILKLEELVSVFMRVRQHLKENGLFMFDMNTLYNMKYGWDNRFSVFWMTDDIFVIESNAHDQKRRTTTKSFTFFVKREDALFERILEEHTERGYTANELEGALTDAGLELVSCYECFTFAKPQLEARRIFCIGKNPP
jgi:ubiquinone/menaquinone biosynthesis C-methylase UbiE